MTTKDENGFFATENTEVTEGDNESLFSLCALSVLCGHTGGIFRVGYRDHRGSGVVLKVFSVYSVRSVAKILFDNAMTFGKGGG